MSKGGEFAVYRELKNSEDGATPMNHIGASTLPSLNSLRENGVEGYNEAKRWKSIEQPTKSPDRKYKLKIENGRVRVKNSFFGNLQGVNLLLPQESVISAVWGE